MSSNVPHVGRLNAKTRQSFMSPPAGNPPRPHRGGGTVALPQRKAKPGKPPKENTAGCRCRFGPP